jgi:hypothetical protein
VLVEQANAIAGVVGQVDGATDVQVDQVTGTPQLLIEPDRQAIARFGLNMEDVQQVIQAAVGGTDAGEIFENIRRFPIHIRFAEDARNHPEAIGNILIDGNDGLRVPLSQIASIKQVVGPRQITREDNQRFISIQCNVVGRDIGSFVAEAQTATTGQSTADDRRACDVVADLDPALQFVPIAEKRDADPAEYPTGIGWWRAGIVVDAAESVCTSIDWIYRITGYRCRKRHGACDVYQPTRRART